MWRYIDRSSVVPSLAGSGWVAGACVNKAFSCQISFLREGEHVWSWFQAAETSSQAAVSTEPEAALFFNGPAGSVVLALSLPGAPSMCKDALGLRFVS